MATEFSATARRLGLFSAVAVVVLDVAYAVTLAVGFWSLASPDQPIGDPMFSILEILIILMMPVLVTLMVAVHAWAPSHAKVLSLTAVVFMGMLAGVTCSLHFVILTVGHHPAFVGQPWLPLLVSFTWPSVAYALDILAWDVFFALAMLCAAPVSWRESPGPVDSRAHDRKRPARAGRIEWGGDRRHATAKHRDCRLPRRFSGCRGTPGIVLLSSYAGRGAPHRDGGWWRVSSCRSW